MARLRRIEYSGALYYITSATLPQRAVFQDPELCRHFTEILAKTCQRFHITVFAFALLPDAYHLVIQTQRGNLSKAMQWMGATFTRNINKKSDATGPLFAERYRYFVLENLSVARRVAVHVHAQPLVHKLSPEAYLRSSLSMIQNEPVWLNLSELVNPEALAHHISEVHHNAAQKMPSPLASAQFGVCIGSNTFCQEIKQLYLEQKKPKPSAEKALPIWVERAATQMGIGATVLTGKGNSARKEKDLFIHWLYNSGHFSNRSIGELMGVSPSAVSHRVRHIRSAMERDGAWKKQVEAFSSNMARLYGEVEKHQLPTKKSVERLIGQIRKESTHMEQGPEGGVGYGPGLHGEKSRRMRLTLIDATLNTLEEHGYKGASLALILEKAEVTKGAWRYHFPDKTALLVAAAEALYERALEKILRAVPHVVVAQDPLLAIFDFLWEHFHQGRHRNIWLELTVAARTDAELNRRLTPAIHRFMTTIDELWRTFVETDDEQAIPVEVLMNLTMNLTRGMAIQTVLHDDLAFYQSLREHWYKMVSPLIRIKKSMPEED